MSSGATISVIDKRKPEKPLTMRQSDVGVKLQIMGTTLYGSDGEPKTEEQKKILGTALPHLRYLRCDSIHKSECETDGVFTFPTFQIGSKKIEVRL